MLEVTEKVWGIMWSVLKKKKKGCSGKDLQKKKVLRFFCVQFQITKVSSHRRLFPHQSIRLRWLLIIIAVYAVIETESAIFLRKHFFL